MDEVLAGHLVKIVEKDYFSPIKEYLSSRKPPPMYLYDLIQGIVGVGIYSFFDERLESFTKEIIRILVGLTKDIEVQGNLVPGWHVPSQYQHLKHDQIRYPLGNFNLGLSHGVTGILSFLSVASIRGISVEGQQEAMEKIATWLQYYRKEDRGTVFWPPVIAFEEVVSEKMDQHAPFSGRDAWCYGTPGVARTLFLAGEALKKESLKKFALDSFRSVFKRNYEQWHLPGPTFCHGISGLTFLTFQMANDTQENDLKEHALSLNQLLLKFYKSDHPFGFKDYVPYGEGHIETDHAGLLEGSTGVLLTLLSMVNSTSWWHSPFLVGYEK